MELRKLNSKQVTHYILHLMLCVKWNSEEPEYKGEQECYRDLEEII
jgi:hypothetical protein